MNAMDYPMQAAVLTDAMIQAAMEQSRTNGTDVMEVLEELASLPPDHLIEQLGRLFHYPSFNMQALHTLMPDFSVIDYQHAAKHQVLVLRPTDNENPVTQPLFLAFTNPFDACLEARYLSTLSRSVDLSYLSFVLVHRQDLMAYLALHEAEMRAMDGLIPDASTDVLHLSGVDDLSLKSIGEESSPVVKLVRSTLYDALKIGASDIHLETDAQGLSIKYRIDGVMNAVGHMAGVEQAEQAISRIKIMSELDIAERRVPQDGRFKVMALGREIDFRVSIMPSVYGEDAVLRILDRKALSEEAQGLSLDVLGFEAGIMGRFRRLAEEPYGMLLVTGPTGSGKTTTLYGILCEINDGQDKIITIEDPVEYQLPGVLQIPVNEKKGLTFARGLRSILRHDPDKIMVGEIRDAETAQIAVQSALTGHLVLTTVHANNVFDVIGRFTNMGVDPYSFVSAMNGILAQRLVRVNCPHCVHPTNPSQALLEKSGLHNADLSEYHFKKGLGCGQCHGTGYKGRQAVAELLIFNDEIRELIVNKVPARQLKEIAAKQGTVPMREAALALVKKGVTTLEEMNRVTSLG